MTRSKLEIKEKARKYSQEYYAKNKKKILNKAKEDYQKRKLKHKLISGGVLSDNGDGSFSITAGRINIKQLPKNQGFLKKLLNKILRSELWNYLRQSLK